MPSATRLVHIVLAASSVVLLAAGGVKAASSTSTDRIVSPSVVASWRANEDTTLLVLWRGTPGWFSKGGHSSGGGGGSSGTAGGRSYAYQYLSYGGLAFSMEFDDEHRVVRLLNHEISLKDTNVVLVDFVGSQTGPTIVGGRWVEPGPPAPPIVPEGTSDPIAGVIRRSPELMEYLQCGLTVPDVAMQAMVDLVCRIVRGDPVTLPLFGQPPR